MTNKIFTSILACFLCGIFFVGVSAFDEDVKLRMKQRLPVIKELKAKRLVGENNKGYLQFVGAEREKEDIVAAENNDRKTVYSSIAKQQGTTADLVGRRRAIQIANKANKGEWLQDASGRWYQK